MTISFPNPSRSYDATRQAVRFWGYDRSMESSFIVKADVLKHIQPDLRFDPVELLRAFDIHRERIYAIADEDLERENDEKTAAVHFVRFELPAAQRERLKRGARLTIGVDHPDYGVSVEASPEQRAALIVDLV